MLKASLGDLLPGMKSGRDIFSAGSQFLLTAGTSLSDEQIEDLAK